MNKAFDYLTTSRHNLAWSSHVMPEILVVANILSQALLENYKPDDINIIKDLTNIKEPSPKLLNVCKAGYRNKQYIGVLIWIVQPK